MNGRHEYDAVIVGARCAGAATALLLARAGLSVLAVEKGRPGADTLSTHALTRAGVRQLSRWGVLDAVRAHGTPAVERVVYHYGDDAVDVPVTPAGDVDGLYAPRRRILDRILADAASASGAEVRFQTTARDLVRSAAGRVTGIIVSDRAGTTAVQARIVIGADGAMSTVARLAGAATEYTSPYSPATVYTYVDGLPLDSYHNHFRPGAAAGVVPTNDGLACVWITAPAEAARASSREFFERTLARAAPEIAARVAGRRGGPFATFLGRSAFLRRRTGPGWALVGDAAYAPDPLSAHGMTDAFVGAELLARAVLATADGADESAAMRAYEDASRAVVTAMLAPVEHAASFAWNLESLQQAHLALNKAMRREYGLVDAFDASWIRAETARRPAHVAAAPPAAQLRAPGPATAISRGRRFSSGARSDGRPQGP